MTAGSADTRSKQKCKHTELRAAYAGGDLIAKWCETCGAFRRAYDRRWYYPKDAKP